MASRKNDVQKSVANTAMRNQINLVNIDTVFPDLIEGAEEASIDLKAIAIAKTSVRGKTRIGAKQGDHVTAYALYVEYIFKLIQDSLLAARTSGYYSTTELLIEIESIQLMNDNLMNSLLGPSNKEYESLRLDAELQVLRAKCEKTIKSFHKIINVLENKNQEHDMSSNILELKMEIKKIRYDYFYAVIQKVSQEYLLLQNYSKFVTFQRNNKIKPPRGEGVKIKTSLAVLRRFNEVCKENFMAATQLTSSSISAGAGSLTSQEVKKSTRIANSKKIKKENETMAQKNEYVKTIASNISTLFFFPRVPDVGNSENVKINEDESDDENDDEEENELQISDLVDKETIRTNDLSILSYVIARHLLIIFETFDYIGKGIATTEEIAVEVVKNIIYSWNSEQNYIQNCKLKYKKGDEEFSVNSNDDLINMILTSFINNQNEKKNGITRKKLIELRGSAMNSSLSNSATLNSPFFSSSSESGGSIENVDDDSMGMTKKKRNRKSGVIKQDSEFAGIFTSADAMQSSISSIDDLKDGVSRLNSKQEIEDLIIMLQTRAEHLKNASSSGMVTGSLGAKNVSLTGFLSIEFYNASKYIEESGKNFIKTATAGLELNTKKVRWLPTIENRNLAGEAQHIANNIIKPLLYMSRSALRTQTGLSQLVNVGIREGFVSGLKQLAMPSCSLDGTTIISSMIRPRY